MRRFLIPLAVLALAGCDQMSLDSASTPAVANARPMGGEGPDSDGLESEIFWFAEDDSLDIQFTRTPGSRGILEVDMLDQFGRVLGAYAEGRDAREMNIEKPELMSVSGPVAQSWDMLVCPVESLYDVPEAGDDDCRISEASVSSKILGYSSLRATSVHYKLGRTIFDYTSTSSSETADFLLPQAMVLPNAPPPNAADYEEVSNVTYTAMRPLMTSPENYVVRGVRLTWSPNSLEFTCEAMSHTGSKGTCPNPGSD